MSRAPPADGESAATLAAGRESPWGARPSRSPGPSLPRVARGRLITIEGIDGAGKTTLAAALHAALRGRGIDVELLREPGGVALAERIRALVKDPALELADRAEALLYAASRAQLVAELLAPTLESGRWVLADRYVDSSLAYQGAGRGLGIDAVRAINAFGTGGLAADRTLLLSIDPARPQRAGERRGERRLAGAVDALDRDQAAARHRVAHALTIVKPIAESGEVAPAALVACTCSV